MNSPRSERLLPLLFGSTLGLSAFLLFCVQPMIAKMALPILGGTPSVWNTCMVFFQACLLGGYLYAHWLTKRLAKGQQVLSHLGLLAAAVLTLPFAITQADAASLDPEENPSFWLMKALLVTAGLPFLAASASAPLLQKWFSQSAHSSARDPYFLYGASNLGSLMALLSYPLVLEPHFRLGSQSLLWAALYLLLVLLLGACGWIFWKFDAHSTAATWLDPEQSFSGNQTRNLSNEPGRQRGQWMLLAFAPSSLMLGVTTYLTTDIASIPLLWIVPLMIYLLSFILTFARTPLIPPPWMQRVLPVGAIALCYLLLTEATEPPWLLLPIHLLVFFVACMACHGQLAKTRPPTRHLTEFYLWISAGGVLGGIFNALIAPALFSRLFEYPLAVVLACALAAGQPAQASSSRFLWRDLIWPAMAGGLTLLLLSAIPPEAVIPMPLRLFLSFGLPLMLCYFLVDHRIRFSLAIGAVSFIGLLFSLNHGKTVHTERNFYGLLRVTTDAEGKFYQLVHGNTIHGRQFVDPTRHCEPLSYYHRGGPLGQIFATHRIKPEADEVAVIGLGAGAMLAYARPNEKWTVYEINPAVVALARNTNYFTFMTRCAASGTAAVLGDARLRIREARSGQFDLILLDAFSSDAIPMHLLTVEAIGLYLEKLAPGGWIAFHISNRMLDLEPILAALAGQAGLAGYAHNEADATAEERAQGKDKSHWVVLARQPGDLGALSQSQGWAPITGSHGAPVWTDDFSNILGALNWR